MAFNKYQVIKNAVNYELANFIFNYFLLKRDAVKWMYDNNITYDTGMLGTWTDQQIPNTYSHYADPVMETLLVKVLPVMAQETGLQLVPTYSYARIYKNGDTLHRHKDRPSCEISTTINLGGEPWPIFIDGTGANNIVYDNGMLGTWTDKQIPNTYSHYADPVMETLLVKVLPVMAQETGLQLVPTYSYARIYKNGDTLHRHKDRPSCEISTTINLGGEPWPIFIDGTGANNVMNEKQNLVKPGAPEGTKVLLEVGDMLVYSGCELEHWREPFEGITCGQVFLHYNHVNGPFAEKNRFDKRPMLGVPPIRNT